MPDPDDDRSIDPERPRLVVEVGDRAHIALMAEQERTGANKTTIVNEAVKLYVELKAIDRAGGQVLIKRPGEKDWEQLSWVPRA
jgi:hypothetical protein